MNRSRRYQQSKPFVSGGVYNAHQGNNNNQHNYQQQQQPPQQQQQQQQQQQYANQSQYQRNNQQASQQQRQVQETQKEQEKQIEEPKPESVETMQEDEEECSQDGMSNNDGNQDNDLDDSSELTDKNGKMRFKKIFLIRKKSSVRAREKKIRQNRQLRKAIMPKNALMALNEVKGIQMSDFVLNNNSSGGFTAVVTVNNSQYEGKGNSKASAKNDACEKALRDYVIAKMIRKPRFLKTTSESTEPMEADEVENPEKEENKDTETTEEQDDVPMVNLASFALFKLFSEWENEGFVVPEMHPTAPNGEANGTITPKEPKKLPIRTELPNNWESMHPATLLCMMRPGVTYTDCGTIGDKPNVMQKMSVVVDEQEFYGTGRSKKIARRNAAVSVCNSLFGTNFEEETVGSA